MTDKRRLSSSRKPTCPHCGGRVVGGILAQHQHEENCVMRRDQVELDPQDDADFGHAMGLDDGQ